MHNFIQHSLSIIIISLLLGSLLHSVYAEEKAPEPTAAIVNGVRIPMSQLDKEMRNIMASNPALKEGRNVAELRKARQDALDFLIIQELMAQEAKKLGFEVPAKNVDAEYAKVKQRFPSEDVFKQVLLQQGLTETKLKDIIKRGLTIRKLLEDKVKPLAKAVTDTEVTEFYNTNKTGFTEQEKIRASHILIKVASNATDKEKADAENQIKDILKQVKGGSDFAELAKSKSQCPSSAQGGDLGYFVHGQMVRPFEDAAFALEVGQISDPVLTEFGYHIIKIADKKQERQMELKEVADQIKEILAEENMNVATEQWIKPIREKADIQIMIKG